MHGRKNVINLRTSEEPYLDRPTVMSIHSGHHQSKTANESYGTKLCH